MVKKKKRWINIDESALVYTDFRRRVWAPKGSSHGIRVKSVNPRVSLIMAIDNFGKIYATLTNVNTDSTVMSLYIRELVKVLSKEDPHFRQSTIFLHDGASYVRNSAFINVLKELHVPFMISGPHSYNIAWVELLFGAIKTGVLNPDDEA
jgi:hypothetical protein